MQNMIEKQSLEINEIKKNVYDEYRHKLRENNSSNQDYPRIESEGSSHVNQIRILRNSKSNNTKSSGNDPSLGSIKSDFEIKFPILPMNK